MLLIRFVLSPVFNHSGRCSWRSARSHVCVLPDQFFSYDSQINFSVFDIYLRIFAWLNLLTNLPDDRTMRNDHS